MARAPPVAMYWRPRRPSMAGHSGAGGDGAVMVFSPSQEIAHPKTLGDGPVHAPSTGGSDAWCNAEPGAPVPLTALPHRGGGLVRLVEPAGAGFPDSIGQSVPVRRGEPRQQVEHLRGVREGRVLVGAGVELDEKPVGGTSPAPGRWPRRRCARAPPPPALSSSTRAILFFAPRDAALDLGVEGRIEAISACATWKLDRVSPAEAVRHGQAPRK